MRHPQLAQSQSTLLKFEQEQKLQYITKLTPNKIKIIQLLEEGHYQAAIARRLKISKSYVSKFVSELRYDWGLLTVEFINPLTHRAVSYRIAPELKEQLEYIQRNGNLDGYTLCTPHRLRYKYAIIGKKKPYSTSTSRFAAAKLKHKRTYCMVGGLRHVFEMKHPIIGKSGVIVHPNSIEVYQSERHHIQAKDINDATSILAMGLNEVANRFIQEQGWENVHMELGKPQLVTSPDYAFNSRIAKKIIERGQSMLKVGDGSVEIDNSLQGKNIPDQAEIELQDVDEAEIIDKALRFSAVAEQRIPALVREEMKSVSDAILNINKKVVDIDTKYNAVAAACQSGLPLQNQFNQIQTIVAQQGAAIADMQKSMLKLIENMGKIIEHIGVK